MISAASLSLWSKRPAVSHWADPRRAVLDEKVSRSGPSTGNSHGIPVGNARPGDVPMWDGLRHGAGDLGHVAFVSAGGGRAVAVRKRHAVTVTVR